MIVIDDFLPDAQAARQHALEAAYIDWQGYDGEVYKRVSLTEVPGLLERIEAVMGPVDLLGMGYRLNFNGELPNAAIHSDLGWGTHALVLYLSEGEGGTAFWRHKATNTTRIDAGQHDLLEVIQHDWDDVSKWEQIGMCPMKLNRAVIYEGANYHSRYPFAAFGTGPEDGRLVAVAFFTPRNA